MQREVGAENTTVEEAEKIEMVSERGHWMVAKERKLTSRRKG